MASMAEILFHKYRTYVASRVEVNDAMSALLASSRLAENSLAAVPPDMLLTEKFPTVEHIERFNVTADRARAHFLGADHHLASVAVPYALATHENFVMEMLNLLKDEGRTLTTNRLRAWNMQTVLFESCGEQEPLSWMESFHVLREMRNCITHAGAAAGDNLAKAIADMGPDARAGWTELTGQPPESVEDDGRLVLTAQHIFTAFAVTNRLGREINALLRREFDRATWSRFAVEDHDQHTSAPRNSSNWRRKALGFVRQNYAALEIEEDDIESAARNLGMWTLSQWAKR